MTERPDPFEEPVRLLRQKDPETIAENAGATWGHHRLILPFLVWDISVEHPSISYEAPAPISGFTMKLLTLLYLNRSDGAGLACNWIPYRELNDGLFYAKNFHETVEERISGRFGSNPGELLSAAGKLGAEPVEQGDAGFIIRTYPRIPLLIILWGEDEEFPASCNVLFDASSTHYLNAFELKMLCLEVAGKMIAVADGKLSLA